MGTHIISAYPCLGKTTIGQLNKYNRVFDRDFNETRSTQGMSKTDVKHFWRHAASLVHLQALTGSWDYIFVTDADDLVRYFISPHPYAKEHPLTIILPDWRDKDYMEFYKECIIERSGQEWYERIMRPRLKILKAVTKKYQDLDLRLTNSAQPFIEDVFEFPKDILLPKKENKRVENSCSDWR